MITKRSSFDVDFKYFATIAKCKKSNNTDLFRYNDNLGQVLTFCKKTRSLKNLLRYFDIQKRNDNYPTSVRISKCKMKRSKKSLTFFLELVLFLFSSNICFLHFLGVCIYN